MRTIMTLLISLPLMAACSSNPHHNARNFALAATVADVISTDRGMKRGCMELNPLYGQQPRTENLVAVNLLIAGGIWWLSDFLEETEQSPSLLYLLGAVRFGLAANNEMVDC